MGKSRDNSDHLINRIQSNRGQNVLDLLAAEEVWIDDFEELVTNTYLRKRVARLLKSKRQRFPDLYDLLDPKMEHGFHPETFAAFQGLGIKRYFELFTLSKADALTPNGHHPTMAEDLDAFWRANKRICPVNRAAWRDSMEQVYMGGMPEAELTRDLVTCGHFDEYVPMAYAYNKDALDLDRVRTIYDIGTALVHPDFMTWPRSKIFDIACATMMAKFVLTPR